jgi:hypothetical protein
MSPDESTLGRTWALEAHLFTFMTAESLSSSFQGQDPRHGRRPQARRPRVSRGAMRRPRLRGRATAVDRAGPQQRRQGLAPGATRHIHPLPHREDPRIPVN